MGLLHAGARLKRPVFLILFALIHFLAGRNAYFLAQDMIRGDGHASELIPQPVYAPYRIRASDLANRYAATGRLGLDFSQIYFSLPDDHYALREAFDTTTTRDPLGRASRIAPLIHVLCHHTFCRFPYGAASVWHLGIQLAIFLAALIVALLVLGMRQHLAATYLFVIFCLFVTPTGLSSFERGQFSLYVGASYLTLVWGLLSRRQSLVLMAALLAFVKWTSLPFVSVVLAVDFLRAPTRVERRFTILAALIFAGVFTVLSIPYPTESTVFVQGLMNQEQGAGPKNLSLAFYLPRLVAKLVPLGMILLGWMAAWRARADRAALIPFHTGAAILLVLYPTIAFEYSLPSILALLPLMLSWAQAPARSEALFLKRTVLLALLVFLVVASFSPAGAGPKPRMTALYVLAALPLMLIPLLPDRWVSRREPAAASTRNGLGGS